VRTIGSMQLSDLSVAFPGLACIVCRESAASQLGMCTTFGEPYRFYHVGVLDSSTYDSQRFLPIQVESLDYSLTTKKEGYTLTSVERTICEMLQSDDTDIQTLCETMAQYYYDCGESWEPLLPFVHQYAVENRFERWREDAESVLYDG
jgi:hypothetical protein